MRNAGWAQCCSFKPEDGCHDIAFCMAARPMPTRSMAPKAPLECGDWSPLSATRMEPHIGSLLPLLPAKANRLPANAASRAVSRLARVASEWCERRRVAALQIRRALPASGFAYPIKKRQDAKGAAIGSLLRISIKGCRTTKAADYWQAVPVIWGPIFHSGPAGHLLT